MATLNTQFHPATSGTVFKPESGKLYIFKGGSVQVMTAWPEPMAWEKTEAKPFWRHCRPDIRIPCGDLENDRRKSVTRQSRQNEDEPDEQLLKLYALFDISPIRLQAGKIRKRDNMIGWARQIPQEIRQIVGRFPKRQWHMLSLLARCGDPAKDLATSSPALAFCLASNWVFHKPAVKWPMRASRTLLRKKQRDILQWLGFPDTKAARKVLAKIKYPSIRLLPLLYLRQAMFDPGTMKTLSHLPKINVGAMGILSNPFHREFISPSLVHEIAQSRTEDNIAKTAIRMYECKRLLDLKYPKGYKKGPIKSMNAIIEMRDDLLRRFEMESLIGNGVTFPTPPVEGTPDIIPITNSRDLFEESEQQSNCVSSYVTNVALDHNYYVYRVLRPQRCTLALKYIGDRWFFHRLKTRKNGNPNQNTISHVFDWMIKSGIRIDAISFNNYLESINQNHIAVPTNTPTGSDLMDDFDIFGLQYSENRQVNISRRAFSDGANDGEEAPF